MAIDTKQIDLSATPVDLVQDADVQAEFAARAKFSLALQNGCAGKLIYLASGNTAPADGARTGLLLRYGDVVVFDFEPPDVTPLWAWTTSVSAPITLVGAS